MSWVLVTLILFPFSIFLPLSLSIIIFLRGGYGIRCIDNDMLIIIDVEHKLYLLSLMDRDDFNPSIYGSCWAIAISNYEHLNILGWYILILHD